MEREENADRIRITVTVSRNGHPDLYNDLVNIDPRHRPERLRLIALMGVYQLTGKNLAMTPVPSLSYDAASDKMASIAIENTESGDVKKEKELKERKERMKADLKKGF